MIFEGLALTTFPMTAAKIGLVVIAVERYFKIVHAIAHRKYYRDCMDDQSGRNPAVDRRGVSVSVSSDWHNKNREWKMSETGSLAKRSN